MKNSSRMVEIIGVAGTGKSTLSSSLYQHDDFKESERLGFNKAKHRIFYIEQILFLLPTFLRHPRNGSGFSRADIKKLVYLNGWHNVLARQGLNDDAIIVVDQGAIFKLATLHQFGPEEINHKVFNEWWDRVFKQWASSLDTVIWLDGPDDILVERIISRDSWHLVKELSPIEARKFFSDYRLAFEYVMSRLLSYKDIPIFRFDTSYQSPEDIKSQVMNLFKDSDHQRHFPELPVHREFDAYI